MLALRTLSRRTTTTSTSRRYLVKSAHKRALNQSQLEGEAKKIQGGGDAIKPASVPPAPPAGGEGSKSSGGGGAIMALLLGGGAVGAAYYNDMIPVEYLPDFMKDKPLGVKKDGNVSVELKQAVKEVKEQKAEETATAVVPKEEPTSDEATKDEPVVETVEHPENGNRVTNESLSPFFTKMNQDKAQEQLDQAQQAATKATQYNEGESTTITNEVNTTLPSSASAIHELASTSQQQIAKSLSSATSTLKSDLEQSFLSDLETLTPAQLRLRLTTLVSEMSSRTKWEAIRIQEFLSLKEKEMGEKYLEILQKQRLEYEELLSRRIREAEDGITRQANEALRAKEEGVQALLLRMREGREREVEDAVAGEVERIRGELELECEGKLQNGLAEMKARHVEELEKYAASMRGMQDKLTELEDSLKVSRQYESGSKRAHAVSAAALALANKLESGEGVEVEVAALRGADEEGGVIASAVNMIPRGVVGSGGKQVLSLGDLQFAFEKSYKKGREAAMVPEGRSGLEGQLLGMLFAKLSVPPSPDTPSTDETDPAIITDSILSTARKYVQTGDLEKAIETLDKLKGQPAYVMNDWKSKAMDRVATERALKVIKLECALLNKDLVGAGP